MIPGAIGKGNESTERFWRDPHFEDESRYLEFPETFSLASKRYQQDSKCLKYGYNGYFPELAYYQTISSRNCYYLALGFQ